MATVTNSQLVAHTTLPTADTIYYTTPASTTAKIGRAVFFNGGTQSAQVTMGIATGSVLNAQNIMIQRTIAPLESYTAPELAGAVIPAGSVIIGRSSVAGIIGFSASGITIA